MPVVVVAPVCPVMVYVLADAVCINDTETVPPTLFCIKFTALLFVARVRLPAPVPNGDEALKYIASPVKQFAYNVAALPPDAE